MITLRIYDLSRGRLAFDLRDLLRLLAPRSLEAIWTISTVKSQGEEWFEATGEAGRTLEALAQDDRQMSGAEISALAEKTAQIIWGEFGGSLSSQLDERWVTIRAVDSHFYEITTADEAVLSTVRAAFQDVRPAHSPIS